MQNVKKTKKYEQTKISGDCSYQARHISSQSDSESLESYHDEIKKDIDRGDKLEEDQDKATGTDQHDARLLDAPVDPVVDHEEERKGNYVVMEE